MNGRTNLNPAVCGVILAGGNSARMGTEKAFVQLGGRPLLAHVIARFASQVALLALNANGEAGRFADFAVPVFPDAAAATGAERQGPLAGLLAALHFARHREFALLATVPADTPFLPQDLVTRLHAALAPRHKLCLAQSPAGLEPLFGLWRTDTLEPVEAAFARGERAIHRLAEALGHSTALFAHAAEAQMFCNINTRGELAQAESALQEKQ